MFPIALSLVVICAQITVFGEEMFQKEMDMENYDAAHTAFYFIAALIEVSLGIWAICITIVGISEIQQISVGKAILNAILPGLIIVTVLVAVMLPFVWLRQP